jgi:hypothetical protein
VPNQFQVAVGTEIVGLEIREKAGRFGEAVRAAIQIGINGHALEFELLLEQRGQDHRCDVVVFEAFDVVHRFAKGRSGGQQR